MATLPDFVFAQLSFKNGKVFNEGLPATTKQNGRLASFFSIHPGFALETGGLLSKNLSETILRAEVL